RDPHPAPRRHAARDHAGRRTRDPGAPLGAPVSPDRAGDPRPLPARRGAARQRARLPACRAPHRPGLRAGQEKSIMSIRTRIGVMVPSTNTSFEADFQMVAPRDVTIHGQRLWLTNDAMGAAGMDRMNAEVESGARYLATARVDVVAYGCTTGSFYRGPGWDREMLDIIQKGAGVPAGATRPSVVEALRFFRPP